MRRFEGQQQGETKRDEAVFTESAAVKVRYISLRLSTPSRHDRAIALSSDQGDFLILELTFPPLSSEQSFVSYRLESFSITSMDG